MSKNKHKSKSNSSIKAQPNRKISSSHNMSQCSLSHNTIKNSLSHNSENTKKEDTITLDINSKYITYILLTLVIAIALYIRVIPPWESIFNGVTTGFAMDDSVFHMRLVESTIANFPYRITYDAYTLYPYGSYLHWGQLFELTIATIAMVIGVGRPSPELVNLIGALFPAVLGALTIIPVFIIGKELLNEKAGLVSALFVAILPGQFLQRSLLGFTDNHVAEVFYLTLTFAFLIVALRKSDSILISRNNVEGATYAILSSIALALYILNWTNGIFFAVVIGIFFILQSINQFLRKSPIHGLITTGAVMFSSATVLILPFISPFNGFAAARLSLLHISVTFGMALILVIFYIVSGFVENHKLSRFYYPIFLTIISISSLILIKFILPEMYSISVGNIDFIFGGRTGGGLTIGESAKMPISGMVATFGYVFYFTIIGIILSLYYALRKAEAKHLLVFTWFVFVLGITLAQVRFMYYFDINVSILAGLSIGMLINFGGKTDFNLKHIAIALIIVLPLIFLPLSGSPYERAQNGAKYGSLGQGFFEWYELLNWTRYNTPQPDLDYNGIYTPPRHGQKYNYSTNDYGIMSWWDYGHIITYWGHRIPNANPFQEGIGGGAKNEPGASTFLLSQSEEEADSILRQLGINGGYGSKYVVSNAYMAYAIQPVFVQWTTGNPYDLFTTVNTPRGQQLVPSQKFFNTMESHLHIFDTNGLKHWRLVHESPPNPNTDGGRDELRYKKVYNELGYGDLKSEISGYAKIFERVEGAHIKGILPPNTTATINITIQTNIGRIFEYTQSATITNNTYEFIVPYSTTGPTTDTNFDTRPITKYTMTIGNTTSQFDVTEEEVLGGKIIWR